MNRRAQISMPSGPLTEAYRALDSVYVETRRHEEAIAALKRTILAGATSGRHSGLALIGPTGSGKTATVQYVERWLRDELNLKVDDPSPLPIVLTTTRSTSKSLVSNVARAGGDPLAGTRTQDDEELNLRDAAPRMQVHGFAFDELHNAFAAKSESELARMAMTLKTLANSLSMPLIAMGINGLEDYLDAHPELRQRFERRVYLDDPEVSSADDVRDMRKLLAAMNAVVPCEADCELATQDMLVRVLLAAECRFGSVINLVRSACAFGAMNRQPQVTLESFCSAYREVAPKNKRKPEDNPFLMPIDTAKSLVKQMQSRRTRPQPTS